VKHPVISAARSARSDLGENPGVRRRTPGLARWRVRGRVAVYAFSLATAAGTWACGAPPAPPVAPPAPPPADATVQSIIQLVIDAPQLEPFYHADEAPNRKPLYLVEGRSVHAGLHLQKFGMAVRVLSRDELSFQGRPYFDITQLIVQGDAAEVHFAYPVEGVTGQAWLRRSGASWTLESMNVAEK
jgi:hypothetical protein